MVRKNYTGTSKLPNGFLTEYSRRFKKERRKETREEKKEGKKKGRKKERGNKREKTVLKVIQDFENNT